jgi:hypothetical protein
MSRLLHLAVVLLAATSLPAGAARKPSAALAEALEKHDATAIREAVASGLETLGERAGTPEIRDKFVSVPRDLGPLTAAEAKDSFRVLVDRLAEPFPWTKDTPPEALTMPLRAVASVLTAAANTLMSGQDHDGKARAAGTCAAAFLIRAQRDAGAGCFPFPAARGTSTAKAMEVATRFLEQAEKQGRLQQISRNGWVFDDLSDGGLQFDNGECGVAMWEWYSATGDPEARQSALAASEWAMKRQLVPNWNYNSFSVNLLAKSFAMTADSRFLEAALQKALLGVIPGQLTDGPRAGRWMDPHNARPAYHYIMIRGLAQLASVIPTDHPDMAAIKNALRLGLSSRNQEIVAKGVMNKDKATEALLLVQTVFASEPEFLQKTESTQALQLIAGALAQEARTGKIFPLSPAEWTAFLAHTLAQVANGER